MRSLLPSSYAIWKLFYQSACCHMQEDNNHHDNVRLCNMHEMNHVIHRALFEVCVSC